MRHSTLLFAALLTLPACASSHSRAPASPRPSNAIRTEVESYLESYDSTFKRLNYATQLAQWASNTHIVEGDSTNAVRARETGLALSRFVGSIQNIERIKGYLGHRAELDPIQLRRLEIMQYNAADAPQTIPDVVRARLVAENAQVERLYGFPFSLNGKPITPNAIDDILHTSTDLSERRAAWDASKEVGRALKPGMVGLRDLRNRGVKSMGYPDFFAYNVSDYGMSSDENAASHGHDAGAAPAALSRAAHVGEVRAGEALSPARARHDPRRLAARPLGSIVGGSRARGGARCGFAPSARTTLSG